MKEARLTADAHHIAGGEHLADIGSILPPYEKAPAVALEPGLHERSSPPASGTSRVWLAADVGAGFRSPHAR